MGFAKGNFNLPKIGSLLLERGGKCDFSPKITVKTSLCTVYNLIKSSTLRPDGVLLTFKIIGMPKEPGIRGKPGEIKNDVFNYIPLILFNFTIA